MNSKKFAALGLALLLGLSACGSPAAPSESGSGDASAATSGESGQAGGEQLTSFAKDYVVATSREVQTLDYVKTALTSDHEINANLVDGLLENDKYGKLKGALAESWEPNEDRSVWTFHLRPDVKWVTNTGEEFGTVKAEDFITGVRHGAEFNSGTSWLLQGVLKGYSEFLKSDFSDKAWSKVGIKAVDDKTVEFTLEGPVPYFDSMTTYSVLYPINKEFLEGKGDGCKLGAPNPQKCGFGSLEQDSILYNGAFILTQNDQKSQAVLTKNAAYWDKDNVFFDTVTRIFDGGEDTYSVMKGYEAGTYQKAGLNPVWQDYDKYAEKYKDVTNYTLPNATTFGVVFNYNRQSFDYTNYAKDKTLAQNTHNAILNENFRKALRAAFDVKSYLMVRMPEDLAVQTMRNINNFPGAGTTSDGKSYFDLVTEAYNAATKENVDLKDGQAPFYSPEKAKEFIAKAKEEGVKFPIHLDVMVNNTSDILTKQAQSMKQSIETNTDKQIIIELNLQSKDTIDAVVYQNKDPEKMDYDISTYTGWGPDYGDPKSYVDIYSATTGYYNAAMGLGTVDKNGKIDNEDIKKQVGFMDYEKLYRDADALTKNLDDRYKAFAKADAFLIEKALYIPTSMETRTNEVSKEVPFSRLFSDYGLSRYKYKGLRTQENPVTKGEFQKALDDFNANR